MLSTGFIFSEKKSDRIKRHLLFWFCFWLLNTLIPGGYPGRNYFSNLPNAAFANFRDLVPQVFFAYVLIEFILPRFLLKNKYLFSVAWILFFLILTGALGYIFGKYIFPKKSVFLISDRLWVNIVAHSKGMLVAATAVCGIRLFKYWHLKEKRNLELLKEKIEAQLQLLTAQIHPHFLFNTLNNIYSKAQDESPEGAKMILELSHILRYVLDEGKRDLVPLENELQMLTDYIHLEQMRHEHRLDLHLSLPAQTEDIFIAPLIFLPFIENCFKQRTGEVFNKSWINLKITLEDTSLGMKLMNGKQASDDAYSDRKNTGLESIQQRLELLYKDKFDLQINEDEEVFIVNLRLEVVKMVLSKPFHLAVSIPGHTGSLNNPIVSGPTA